MQMRRLLACAVVTIPVAATASVSEKPGACPTLAPGTIGLCIELCASDTDCPDDDKCCPNGCGHVCDAPVLAAATATATASATPTLEKPGECPTLPPGAIGICIELCASDADCPDDDKCCSNGCGHVCDDPVLPTATATATPTMTSTETPTVTATSTATSTATNTRVPQGGTCDDDPSTCQAGLFCTNQLCCNTECTGATERCDLPGREGTCTDAVAAPAVSIGGLLTALLVLSALAFVEMVRRRRN